MLFLSEIHTKPINTLCVECRILDVKTGGTYRRADKSLAPPGRKQATATEDLIFIYPIYNHNWSNISTIYIHNKTSLRRRSSAASLLRLWVRIPPAAWTFVYCECCVLSGRGLCDGLITRPVESYRLWRLVVCDQETSKTMRLKSATGL